MEMFSTNDKRNSHSRSSKLKKDESELVQKDLKKSTNKSKILTKLGKNITAGSQKKIKKLYSENLFDIKRKNSKKLNKKSTLGLLNGASECDVSRVKQGNEEPNTSLVFSKFLRSMEVPETPSILNLKL